MWFTTLFIRYGCPKDAKAGSKSFPGCSKDERGYFCRWDNRNDIHSTFISQQHLKSTSPSPRPKDDAIPDAQTPTPACLSDASGRGGAYITSGPDAAPAIWTLLLSGVRRAAPSRLCGAILCDFKRYWNCCRLKKRVIVSGLVRYVLGRVANLVWRFSESWLLVSKMSATLIISNRRWGDKMWFYVCENGILSFFFLFGAL